MAKTLLYRIFGLGKVPKRVRPVVEQEGIVLMDEGIRGSVTFKKFRAPGRRYSWRRKWFSGSIVFTEKRFLAFTYFNPIINVPFDHPSINELECSLQDEQKFCVGFDVSKFHEGWSGTIECLFSTPNAPFFLERFKAKTGSV